MQFKIEHNSERPVYQQLVDQVKHDVAAGMLRSGDKLPTIRQLAAELVMNPNTIAKAYRMLEQEGIIATRPGAGAFVAMAESGLSKSVRKRIICQGLERVIVEAVHMDIERDKFMSWVDESVKKFKFKGDEELSERAGE